MGSTTHSGLIIGREDRHVWSAESFSPTLPAEYTISLSRGLHPRLVDDVSALRENAWRHAEYNLERDSWLSESDFDSRTLLMFVHTADHQLVGSARLSVHDTLESLQDWKYYVPYRSHFTPPIASVTKVVVDPEHQRHGIGTYLHFQAMEHAQVTEARCISCDVLSTSMGICERLGYTHLGYTEPQDGWPKDWYWAVMVKPLGHSHL